MGKNLNELTIEEQKSVVEYIIMSDNALSYEIIACMGYAASSTEYAVLTDVAALLGADVAPLANINQNNQNKKTITCNEEIYLISRAKDGNEEAKEKILDYMKPRMSYRSYQCLPYTSSEWDYEDCMQEATIAILKLIKMWDFTKLIRLTTYCDLYLKKELERKCQNKTIHIPLKIKENIIKLKGILHNEGRDIQQITSADIQQILECSKAKADTIYDVVHTTVVHTDAVRGEGGLLHNVSDGGNIEDEVIQKDFQKDLFIKIRSEIKKLPELEQTVICSLYGFNVNNEPKSQRQLELELHIPRQRISAIDKKFRVDMAQILTAVGYAV